MIAIDENSLICDLAETYGIFNYRALPVKLLATLSVGLRDNSRIKMKLAGVRAPVETILLASAVDSLSFLAWAKTKDAEKGMNRPKAIINQFLSEKNSGIERNIEVFDSAEEFEAARQRIIGGKSDGN